MAELKTRPGDFAVVTASDLSRMLDARDGSVSGSAAEKAVETARKDRVLASADRVMRKHRATFAALAK